MEQSTSTIIDECPICGHSEHLTHLILDDYFLTKEEFSIKKCKYCGLMQTIPQPSIEDIGKYYDSPDYISHATTKKSLKEKTYDLVRGYTLKTKLSILNNYSEGNRLLDIGCATGVFIDYCRKHGFTVQGIEPDNKSRTYAQSHYKLEVNDTEKLESLPPKSFDVITMWHVLEHVHDVNERISLIENLLTDKGVLIIALPNPASFDAQYYGKYWAAYDVPRHLYHFSKDCIDKLCAKFSLKVIQILPMKFDSFYISMLSEQYKNGKVSLFKAFTVGLKSNLKARHCTNHSSLIYVIKRTNQ